MSSSVVAEAMPLGECGFGRFLSRSLAFGTEATFPDLWSPGSCGIKTFQYFKTPFFCVKLADDWWSNRKKDGLAVFEKSGNNYAAIKGRFYLLERDGSEAECVRENMNDERENMINQEIGLRGTNAWVKKVMSVWS